MRTPHHETERARIEDTQSGPAAMAAAIGRLKALGPALTCRASPLRSSLAARGLGGAGCAVLHCAGAGARIAGSHTRGRCAKSCAPRGRR